MFLHKIHHQINRFSLTLIATFASLTPGLVLNTTQPVQAQTNFSCGFHLRTYVVKSANGEGKGIRCVKFTENNTDPKTPRFVWYGEGNWSGRTYRHVGQAQPGSRNTYIGYASDIHGNGEYFNGSFDGNLSIQVTGKNKERIRVTGAWNETWEQVKSTTYQPLTAATTCGSYFDEYRVVNAVGNQEGSGLRCVLRVGFKQTTWLGTGNWEGTTYSHLGTRSAGNYGADDICGENFGSFCNTFDYGSLNFQPTGEGFAVTGAWDEVWLLKSGN